MSKARNLVPGDTNERSDVFVHDRVTGETTRVSVAGDGSEGDHHSTSPSMSADDTEYVVSDEVSVTVLPVPTIEVSIGDATVSEGTGGLTEAVLSVTLSAPSPGTVTADYVTRDGSALAGCDYQTRFGTLQLEPGTTTTEIRIPIVGDLAEEPAETFRVELGNAVGADILGGSATVTIQDDDLAAGSNARPGPIGSRTPENRSMGTGAVPLLGWSAADPDSDPLVFDVYFGTSSDLAGQVWTHLCTASSPAARSGAASAYDEAGDRLIVFGGELARGADSSETWVLDNASGRGGEPSWSLIDAGTGPSARARAVAAYDPATNRLVVHGGCSAGCTTSLGDTWVLTEANGLGGPPAWVSLPPAPVARNAAASAYDPSSNRLVVFGGSGAGGASNTSFAGNDVWVLSDANGLGAIPSWAQLSSMT